MNFASRRPSQSPITLPFLRNNVNAYKSQNNFVSTDKTRCVKYELVCIQLSICVRTQDHALFEVWTRLTTVARDIFFPLPSFFPPIRVNLISLISYRNGHLNSYKLS